MDKKDDTCSLFAVSPVASSKTFLNQQLKGQHSTHLCVTEEIKFLKCRVEKMIA